MEPGQNETIYKKGKIYKLECNDGHYYIGSTVNQLKYRLANHKQDSKKFFDRLVYKHIETIGWNSVEIKLIEEYPCNSNKELHEREDYYINEAFTKRDDKCLNFIRANVTSQELKDKQKQYREENSDKIKEYRKVYNNENSESRVEYTKKWREEHKEQNQETRKKYYEEHKEEILEKCKKYLEENKEEITERKKKWTLENKDYLKQQNKEWREEHKEQIQEKGKQYYEENRDLIREKQKQYNEENKEKINAKMAEYREKIKAIPATECACGGSYKLSGVGKHMRTEKHKKHLELNPVTA